MTILRPEQNHFREWLIDNPIFILSKIERKVPIPKGTLLFFVNGKRGLAFHNYEKLVKFFNDYGYNPKV